MRLFAGLGNPGERYAGHRHNIGFMMLDEIARHHRFPAGRTRFSGVASEGRLGGEKAVLLKPMTWMNESGRSLAAAASFYKLDPADIVVFHDELDLAPGKVRVKRGGGAAGHNGLRSIIAHLGPDFLRVRLGIGHPGVRELVTPYVLSNFSKAERDWVDRLCKAVAEAAPWLAEGDCARFMTEVARRAPPPRDDGVEPAPESR